MLDNRPRDVIKEQDPEVTGQVLGMLNYLARISYNAEYPKHGLLLSEICDGVGLLLRQSGQRPPAVDS